MSIDTSKLIKELNRLDLDKIEYGEVLEKIKPLVIQIPMFIQMSQSSKLYFRSRVCNYKEIDSINELLAPPKESVTGFQRCNSPGKSMFYSSSKRITTLLECNVGIGDIVYLSQWISKEPIPLNVLFSNNIENNSPKSTTSTEEIIINYLDTIFTRPIHKSFSNSYKLTSAITELITNKFKPSKALDIRDDKTMALLYPSILDISGSHNIVLPANLAKTRLQPVHIMKLKVIERDGRSIKVKIIDNGREVLDGKINWLKDETKIPLPIENKNKGLIVQWTGNSWSIPVGNSELTQEIIEKILNE